MELEGAEDTVDSSQSGGPGEQDEDNVGAATGVTAAGEEEALPEQDGPKRARTFSYGEMLVEAGMLSEEEWPRHSKPHARKACPSAGFWCATG